MASGRIRPSRMLMAVWTRIALLGVLNREWILVSAVGSALARAMPYRNRVDAFVHAMDTEIAEINSANRTTIQPSPQYFLPSTKDGSTGELANEASRLVPQPVIWPQDTTTRKTPRMTMEPITARGMFRLGLRLSSASGAAASQPVMAKMANTTPRNSPCAFPRCPAVVSHCRFSPPGPGLASPHTPSASTMMPSMTPSQMISFTDSSTPRHAVQATSAMRKIMNHHHSKVIPYSALRVDCRVDPMNDPTCAMTTG